MYAVNDRIEAQCPQCADEVVYVEMLVSLPDGEGDAHLCRCGKCGWRFRVVVPDFTADAPALA